MSAEERPCTLTISRSNRGDGDDVIRLVAKVAGLWTIIEVTPANFAMAVTGLSEVPATVRDRAVSVGKG